MFGVDALAKILRDKNLSLSTAESCTGGGLGSLLTSLSGSSDYYYGGFVTYANLAKEQLLGIDPMILKKHGAVSEQCAVAMANRCRSLCGTSLAVSVTGIAGPSGGSLEKPVGLVFIGVSGTRGEKVTSHRFSGSRDDVRRASIEEAIIQVLLYIKSQETEG